MGKKMLVDNKSFVPKVNSICTIITRQGIEYMGVLKGFDPTRYTVENPAIVTSQQTVRRLIQSTDCNFINLRTDDIILCAISSSGELFDAYTLEME